MLDLPMEDREEAKRSSKVELEDPPVGLGERADGVEEEV